MNRFVKASLALALAAVPSMADEAFGGIGVTIFQSRDGVNVAEVIPGGPASETNLKAGDVIIAVDGVSLKGKNIDESKEIIRGQVNKPLEITYVSAGDTNSAIIRRTGMTIKDLDAQAVSAWYGNQESFDSHELEAFASSTEADKQLLAVMQHGYVVGSDAKVKASNLNGVYIEKVNEFAPKAQLNKGIKATGATLSGFSRTSIAFSLKNAGATTIKVSDVNGEVVASIRVDNAVAGINSVSWNSEKVPSGRYMVSLEQAGSVSGKYVVLK